MTLSLVISKELVVEPVETRRLRNLPFGVKDFSLALEMTGYVDFVR